MGKKLDFILQEMFRELNTCGVKCNFYEISKLVVECKTEVEKIREQVNEHRIGVEHETDRYRFWKYCHR